MPEAPAYFVADISDTFDLKVQAIRAYRTQFPSAKEGFFARLEAANRYWGQAAGFAAGELLRSHRAIGTADCMRIAAPGHAR